MGVCSHFTYNASYSPFYAINPPTILFRAVYNSELVTLTFSVAVTYAYNTFAYIIPIRLQMHSINVTLAVCMFHSLIANSISNYIVYPDLGL